MEKPRGRFARVSRFLGRIFLVLLILAAGAGAIMYWRSDNECPAPGEAAPANGMKTWIHCEYGSPDVMRVATMERPAPHDSQVFVRVRAVSLNAGDWRVIRGEPLVGRFIMGLRKPSSITLGTDFAGVVEAVGRSVTRFRVGDSVWGARSGSFAEYVTVRESRVMPKPPNITLEQAAGIPVAAITALQGLRDQGQVKAGQRVLINGASGGVGTFAVQIARSLGAEVTAICSTRNIELVKSLGADRVIDYTKEDFTLDTARYDVVIDNVGNRSFGDARRVLSPTGTYVLIGGGKGRWLAPFPMLASGKIQARFTDQDMKFFIARFNEPDLQLLHDMIASGRLTPAVDRTFPFSELPEAIRYMERGARAKVIVTVE